MDQLDADVVRQWAATATTALGSARARIDAVNVFPVPDSDTGTNVFLTVASGTDALAGLGSGAAVAEAAVAFARGALVGARGNSGVIVSQFLEGFALFLESRPDEGAVGPVELAEAFEAAQLA
ncbi:MAG TPA: DAK2 domain-containing protein, partial [Cellulomonadaceae bacterium]|nr:DAK2 domain-containing protein [Cellulomonadaceae bacterium]